MALGDFIPESVLAPARRVGAAVQHWYDTALTLNPDDRELAAIRAEQGQMYDLINEAMVRAHQLAVQDAQNRENLLAEAQQREAITLDPQIISSDLKFYFTAAKEIMDRENAIREEQGLRPFNIQQFADMRGHAIENMTFRQTDIEIITRDDDPLGLNLEERGLEFRMSGAHLRDVCFIPATTFNSLCGEDSLDVTIEGAIFRGMGEGDTLHLRAGEYSQIEFAEVNGGTLQLDPRAIVRECDVRGAQINIVMGNDSALIGLRSDNATRVITFEAGERARIESADISGATISPNSELRGTQWVNVNLSSVNMRGVDFTGANFTQVTMDGNPITYDTLIQAGVEQLPASITNERGTLTLTQYQNWQQEMAANKYAPGSPQAMVMAEAKRLAQTLAGNGEDTEEFKAQRTIQTQAAREGIERANAAFAESQALIRLHEKTHSS